MPPRKNTEIPEGWKLECDEVSYGVWKVSIEDKMGRRFETTTLDEEEGLAQCKTYALNIEQGIADKNASFNPWDFSNRSPQTHSHDRTHRIIYHDLHKIAQGSPLIGKAFLLNDLDISNLIDANSGGPPIWNGTKNIVAVQVWRKTPTGAQDQRIAIVDAAAHRITIYAQKFETIKFIEFNDSIIKLIDDPLNKKIEVTFDILSEVIYEEQYLR